MLPTSIRMWHGCSKMPRASMLSSTISLNTMARLPSRVLKQSAWSKRYLRCHAQSSLSIPPRLSTSMAKPSSSAAQAILAKMASKSMDHINSSRLNGISSWRADVASLAVSAAATLFASRLGCLSMATNFLPTFLLSWLVSASSANSTKRSS